MNEHDRLVRRVEAYERWADALDRLSDAADRLRTELVKTLHIEVAADWMNRRIAQRGRRS